MTDNYISHMRAEFFDESEQPIHTVDGQFIAVHSTYLICDGKYHAQLRPHMREAKWFIFTNDGEPLLATRVAFWYVDANGRTLPDN